MRYFIFGANFTYDVYDEDELGGVLNDYSVDKNRMFSCVCQDFPTHKELKELVKKENKYELDSVTILSVTELNETDFNKFWSEK